MLTAKNWLVELTLVDGYSNHMSLTQQGKQKWNYFCLLFPVYLQDNSPGPKKLLAL